jgi:hypothetical protein
MQVLDSGGGWFAGGAERAGRPLSGRTRRSPRTEDTRSLQVRRRGREPSPMTTGTAGVPAVAATGHHRATRAPLPYIKVEQQPSGLRDVSGSKPRRTSRTAACTGGADDGGGPDTDTFLASLETSLAASREVFASVPANTRLGAAMGTAAAAAATTAAGPSPKTTGKALSQGRKGGTTGEGSGGGGERGGDHYQQQQQQRPRADDEATAKRLQRRLRLDQQPESQLEPENELEQRPRSTPEPEPEPEPAIDDLERRMQAIQQDQDRRRREDECAQSTPLEPAADFDGIGMEELEQRLLSLQRTQDRRRDELDSYMTSLRSREVASDDGTTESLVEFPEGFMEIVESMKREEMERPWLSYLGEENAPKEGETDEQRRNRRGVELIARLDKILAEKTKEAKRAAAFRKLQQRLQAEEQGEEVAAVQGNRAAVSKRLDETMSDTVGKLVRRNLGALSASRFITLSDEREARVAQLLEEDGNGRSYHVDTGYDKERIDEIDDRLRAFHPDTEPVALGIAGSVEAGREAAAGGDGEANLAPSDGATSISARSSTPHAARPTSDVDAGQTSSLAAVAAPLRPTSKP